VAVHLGSLLAVLLFVWREIRAMLTARPRLLLVLIVATLPIAVVGPFAKPLVQGVSGDLRAVGGCLLFTAAVLAFVRRRGGGTAEMARLSLPRAAAVGCAQVLALLPGVSRSGMTLSAGLEAGLEREHAVRFAFLMAAPAIFGAGIFMVREGGWGERLPVGPLLAGATVSFLASLAAMRLLLVVVARRRLGWFALYCAVVGVLALALGLS